jgi:hypothetical protein
MLLKTENVKVWTDRFAKKVSFSFAFFTSMWDAPPPCSSSMLSSFTTKEQEGAVNKSWLQCRLQQTLPQQLQQQVIERVIERVVRPNVLSSIVSWWWELVCWADTKALYVLKQALPAALKPYFAGSLKSSGLLGPKTIWGLSFTASVPK